jgi:hypothetical protein
MNISLSNQDEYCISNDGSNCFCNEEDYKDPDNYEMLHEQLLTPYCKHNYYGIRSSRDRVTMKGQCTNYNTSRSIYCYICNVEFKHKEWRNTFWGCNECFKEKVNSNSSNNGIYIQDIQLCIDCSISELIFHHNDIGRRTGLCSFKRSMLTKDLKI